MDGWTTGIVFFALPWVEFLVAAVMIQQSQPVWFQHYDRLVKRWPVPERGMLRSCAILACCCLSVAGVLAALRGTVGTGVYSACMGCHTSQLAGVAVWLVLCFDRQQLWHALGVAVLVLCLSMAAMVTCTLSTPLSLLFYMAYWVAVCICTLATGYAAFDNPGTPATQPSPQAGATSLDGITEPEVPRGGWAEHH